MKSGHLKCEIAPINQVLLADKENARYLGSEPALVRGQRSTVLHTLRVTFTYMWKLHQCFSAAYNKPGILFMWGVLKFNDIMSKLHYS